MKTWTMRDGSKIEIKKMTDTHLCNAMRMMRRNATKAIQQNQLAAISVSCGLIGEMAQDAIESEIRGMEMDLEDPESFLDRNPAYHALNKEYRRRKLTADLGVVL